MTYLIYLCTINRKVYFIYFYTRNPATRVIKQLNNQSRLTFLEKNTEEVTIN